MSVSWNRFRRRRRFSFAAANIRRPIISVLFRCLNNQGDPIGLRRFKQLLQERHTPPAAGPRTTALADLTGHTRAMNPQKVLNLSLTDVKAVTQFIIRLHGEVLSLRAAVRTDAETTVIFRTWSTFLTCSARWNRAPLISVSILRFAASSRNPVATLCEILPA